MGKLGSGVAENDKYGISKAATVSELLARWPSLQREIFFSRYTRWPADVRHPTDEVWAGAWDGILTGPSVMVMRSPKVERLGSIYIPEPHQAERGVGFVVSVSPMLLFADVLESVHHRPMFDHVLDIVGVPFMFQPYQGIEIRKRLSDQDGKCQYVKINVMDLMMLMTTLEPVVQDVPARGSERDREHDTGPRIIA